MVGFGAKFARMKRRCFPCLIEVRDTAVVLALVVDLGRDLTAQYAFLTHLSISKKEHSEIAVP